MDHVVGYIVFGVDLNPSGGADRGPETDVGGGADQETGAATEAAPEIVAGEAEAVTVPEVAGMLPFSLPCHGGACCGKSVRPGGVDAES